MWRRASAGIDEYSGHADGPELARWIASRRPIERGVFLVHGEEAALAGLTERIAERDRSGSQSVLARCLMTFMSSPRQRRRRSTSRRRRRLAPEAVTNLDWHNDMSKLILDINERSRVRPPTTAPGASLFES